MTQRIGLLGGTFDPPHLGHLIVAEAARVALRLDVVRFLVAGDPWMKSAVTDAATRLRLTQAAIAGDPYFEVDGRELRRSGATYTADTLAELAAEEPGIDWYFLLGIDAARDLHRWERIEQALDLATFVVVSRPPQPSDEDHREPLQAPAATSSHARGPFADRLQALDVPLIGVSSTDLRERYRQGWSTRFLVPDAVESIVRSMGLYGA